MTEFLNKRKGIINWKIENSLKIVNCKLKILVLIVILFMAPVTMILAADDQIQVRQLIFGLPLSAPSDLVAITTSCSQIDLSWTDNSGNETGFKIERSPEGSSWSQIDTVTADIVSYSDTGLSEDTDYYYRVRAYNLGDDSGYSNTANSATSICPITPTPTPISEDQYIGVGGWLNNTTLPNIREFVIQVSDVSAVILWRTIKPAKAKFFWGLTEEYEMGSIAEVDFLEDHKVVLFGLTPDTVYHFQIFLKNEAGNEKYMYDRQFRTSDIADIIPPANVGNFTAVRLGEEKTAGLIWKNPEELDLAGVRIVRSTKFFPTDIYGGTTVYDSIGEFTEDTDIQENVMYYYTAFSYDVSGNYSSGAIATFRIYKPGESIPPIIPILIPPELVPLEIEKMLLEYFEFYQNGIRKKFIGGKVYIDADESIEIFLDYEKAPEVLKTIMITLAESATEQAEEKKTFSFLLRVNKDKAVYTAKIAPLKEPGLYEVSIAVLDYKNQALKKFRTFLLASVYAMKTDIVVGEKRNWLSKYIHLGPLLLPLLVLFLFVKYLIRTRGVKEF